MRRILATGIVFFMLNTINSQAQDDHLVPVNGLFNLYNFEFEYYSQVRKILFNGLSDSPEIRFQVMPSFFPERVLDMELDREKGLYHLVYHICEQPIWYNKEWDKVKVIKYRKTIDKKSAGLVYSLFKIAISQSRFPKDEKMGLDGTNYYFAVSDFGLRTGTVWSPAELTHMRRLVDIGEQLIELMKGTPEFIQFNENIISSIERLKTDLLKE